MVDVTIPDGISADYENVEARRALEALQAEPDYERLAELLLALRDGYLVVDVTGTPRKKSTRIRTIRSTKGQLILPLFTSMAEVREAVASGGRTGAQSAAKGAVMPALEALNLIETDRFVAAQLDPASAALVVLRKYIQLAASSNAITPDGLAALK